MAHRTRTLPRRSPTEPTLPRRSPTRRAAPRRSLLQRLVSWPARFVRHGRGPIRRLLRGLVLLVVLLMIPAAWSYAGALTAPGSAPLSARTVEWLSNDVPGGRPVVLLAERIWYTWNAPPVGGTPAGGLPYAKGSDPKPGPAGRLVPAHLPAPLPIRPIAAHPLPHEGQWEVVGRWVDGVPAIRVAYLRPDPIHTSLVAGVMWMDTRLLRAALVPGTQVPTPGASWPGLHWWIPPAARASLAATFNAGFLIRDANGGWYGEGRMAVPLVAGDASLVIYKNGTATVAQWGRDATMGPDVAAVRQNLRLIVDGGRVTPGVTNNSFQLWGATLGNAVMVWRSGVGVTRDGALVYAAGPGLSVQSLAAVLVRAGAVRAMELDINTDWTSAMFYGPAPGTYYRVSATKLLSDMIRPETRYLVPDERDFIAMFVRQHLQMVPARRATAGTG